MQETRNNCNNAQTRLIKIGKDERHKIRETSHIVMIIESELEIEKTDEEIYKKQYRHDVRNNRTESKNGY